MATKPLQIDRFPNCIYKRRSSNEINKSFSLAITAVIAPHPMIYVVVAWLVVVAVRFRMHNHHYVLSAHISSS